MALGKYFHLLPMAGLLVVVILSWLAYSRGDTCSETMAQYILTVAITSTIMLGTVIVAFFLGLFGRVTATLFNIVSIFSTLIELLWLVWGIVELALHNCPSFHFSATIGIVVVSFILLVLNAFGYGRRGPVVTDGVV